MGRKRRRGAAAPAPAAELRGAFGATGAGRRRVVSGGVVAATLGALALYGTWAGGRRPSLLLITIDTLRADRVGAYGRASASTPHLDDLARRGTRFAEVQSAVPLTGPSHATILTGLYPPAHGVRDNVNFLLDARHATLATRLKPLGYRTAAFVGAYPVAGGFGFSQGFDVFDEGFHQSAGFGQGAERPGNEVADATLKWLASRTPEEPFFAWVHLYDPHAPYTPPPPYADRFRDDPYDGEVAFADAQVGRLLDALRASGRDGETIVAVVADHGEALGEHGEGTHAVLVYEATLRVPLILAGPGVPAGRVVASRVGTADLVPTLIGLLGAPPPRGLPGRDLRPALSGGRLHAEAQYAESLFGRLNCRWASLRGWTEGDWKLIDGAEPELYNLAEDPAETRNRAGDDGERVRRMRDALAAAVSRMAPGGDSARPVTLSAEQEERLRSLGYAGGGSGGGGALDAPGLPDPRAKVHLYEALQKALGAATAVGHEQSLREAVRLAESDPGNPFAHFTVASLAYRSGRLEIAERAFARALDLDPDRPGQRLYYGQVLREMGRLEDSERQLRIALEQAGPVESRVRLSLAETLLALGRTDEAEGEISGILAREAQNTEAHGAMGRLLVARGRHREAIAHLEKAANLRDLDTYFRLAGAHLQAGDPGSAREAAAKALSRNPGHPWGLALLGHALILEGRRDEGLSALRKARALGPRRAEVWLGLGAALEAAGDRSGAASCRKEAAALRGRG